MSDHTSEWVSLRQAADLLGVHPATVRNWADKGELPSRRTPGGHRRFRRDDLLHHAETQGEMQPAEVQVILQSALGKTRMQVGGGTLADVPWYAAMSDQTRSNMRDQGRRVLEDLRRYLASGAPDEELSVAITVGMITPKPSAKTASHCPRPYEASSTSAIIINSVLTWSEITPPHNPSEWATMLRQINTFINAMLLSIVEYYEEE